MNRQSVGSSNIKKIKSTLKKEKIISFLGKNYDLTTKNGKDQLSSVVNKSYELIVRDMLVSGYDESQVNINKDIRIRILFMTDEVYERNFGKPLNHS